MLQVLRRERDQSRAERVEKREREREIETETEREREEERGERRGRRETRHVSCEYGEADGGDRPHDLRPISVGLFCV